MPLLIGAEQTKHLEQPENLEAQKGASENTPLLNEYSRSYTSGPISAPAHALLGSDENQDNKHWEIQPNASAIIYLLLTGVFIANADQSLVLASNSTISSDLNAFQSASWLSTSYIMSTCVAQPIVGKLSDILGRKDALLGSYILFAIGSTICGVGQTMWQVITGRLIAGLGGAGMTVLVSVVITDLVPMSDVAPWRSYVNVVATTGRMAGGPLGGFLTDSLGWRWSFLGQVPLTLIALASISLKLRSSEVQESDATPPNSNTRSKIGRIDFIGATLLSITIISLLFAIDLLGRGASWNSPFITGTSVGFIAFSTIFFIYEAYYAIEPIWTLRLLLVRNVAATYWINILHAGAQVGLMFSVPLYFQAIQGASNSAAGASMIPAFIGNTIGALVAGYYIKASGHYKYVTSIAALIVGTTYLTIILRWKGPINNWEVLEIFPSGFGTGLLGASTFIGLTACLAHKDMSVATSGHYLTANIGGVVGLSISSGIQKAALKWLLQQRLKTEGSAEIIEHVLADVSYVQRLKEPLRQLVRQSYVRSFEFSHGYSLFCSVLVFIISLAVEEFSLQ